MLFDFFKRKKKTETEELVSEQENAQWNKMWDLWANGEIASPYNELMTYQSEVNNGGHSQYFINTENTSDLVKEMAALDKILPVVFKVNLQKAYQAHLLLEADENNEEAENIIEKCDSVFFKNEEQINEILDEFSETM